MREQSTTEQPSDFEQWQVKRQQTTANVSRQSLTAEFYEWNQKSIESIIKKAEVLQQGKKALSKKEWTAWVKEDLRLSTTAANYYHLISKNATLKDEKHWPHLPDDYRTLYELSLIKDDKLLECIANGDVHHGLTRREATELKNATLGKKKRGKSKDDDGWPADDLSDYEQAYLNALRIVRGDKALQDYMRDHPIPAELPDEALIQEATDSVIKQIQKKSGKR
jgi:hypothetical protein